MASELLEHSGMPWLSAAAARQALSGTAQLVRSCATGVVTPLRPLRFAAKHRPAADADVC